MNHNDHSLDLKYGKSSMIRSLAHCLIVCPIIITAALIMLPVEFFIKKILKLQKVSTIIIPGTIGTFLSKYITGIEIQLKGLENLQKEGGGCIIASNHESTIETAILAACTRTEISYVLKQSLISTPPWNLFYLYFTVIGIDRDKRGVSAIKSLLGKIKTILDQGKNLIIFPEGTRVPLGSHKNFKPTVLSLGSSHKVVPVAHNGATIYGRSFFDPKRKGKVIISFLPAVQMKENETPKDFTKRVEGCVRQEYGILINDNSNYNK